MSYQKDYILRMMEMMAEVIAIFLGLLKKGDIQQAEKRLNNAYREFLKEDAIFFHRLPQEQLTHQLMEEHNYTHQHLKVLSELFYAEGELLLKKGNKPNAKTVFEKALIIREYTNAQETSFSLAEQQRLHQLKSKIADLNQL